jgi:predicted phosphohydrolase
MKMSRRLQYISDIHLEYRSDIINLKKAGNYLSLNGDIGNPFKDNYKDFIRYTSQNWEKVFLLTGNHSYWNSKYNMKEVDQQIENITTQYDNVYFMNNKQYDIDDKTIILGTTLWSDANTNNGSPTIGDNLYITYDTHNLTAENIRHMYQNNVLWLINKIDENKTKDIIVLSHHLPSYELIIPQYKTEKYAKFSDRFASNLDYLIKKPIKYWICGHSHCILEKKINNVDCRINAYGYSKEGLNKNMIPKWIDI